MSLIERLILQSDDDGLIGGLVWRAPSAGQSRVRALREAKALMPDASHYVQVRTPDQIRFGIYQPRASEEGVALPKGTLAAAACFSNLVGDECRNAALVLTVPAIGHRREERLLVVCLEDGVPVVDVLSNETEARNALGVEDRPIWSDNAVAYPSCRPASFEWLASGAHRPCRMARIPPDPWPAVAAIGVAVVLLGGWSLADHLGAARRARAEAERARAADPTPRYLSELQSRRSRMSSERSSVLDAVRAMFDYPLSAHGWLLASAECSTSRHRCSRRWIREGGTFDDLRKALPTEALEVPAGNLAGAVSFEFATTYRPWEPARGPLGDGRHPLRSAEAEFTSAAPLLQIWRTAHIALDFGVPALWPRVADVSSGFRPPNALMAGDVQVRDVPGPLILETLRDAPGFISWEDIKVDIDSSGDARAALKFSASGVFYALQ
jgi:hypothetical protein